VGSCDTISADQWPKQGYHLGKRVSCWFQNDDSFQVEAIVVRDDAEHPWVTILQLETSKRLVLGTECTFVSRGK
jgi:hypothetical protein